VASSTAVARALTLDGTSTAANTISGAIADNGAGAMSLTKNGTGTWVLSGNNTYTGTTSMTAGTLTLSGSGTFGTGSVNISGGTIDLGGKTITNAMGTMYGGAVNNGTIDLTGNTWYLRNGTVGAVLSGTGGVIHELGGSTAFLSGNNTYTGETWVSFGTLELDNVNAVKNSTVRFEGGGFLTFGVAGTNTYNLGNLKGSSGAVTIDMGGNTLSVGANNGTYTYVGMLGGTGGNLTKVGTGALTLTGGNTGSTYTGTTTVEAGSLVAAADAPSASAGPFGNASSAIVLGNGNTLVGDAPSILINGVFTVARNITVGSVSNAAAYNATIGGSNTSGTATYTGNITLNTTAGNYTVTLDAAPGGTVNFSTGTWTTNNKAIAIGDSTDTGTVQLSHALSTTGGISVNYGALTLNSAFTGNMTVASGTTLGGNGSVSGTTGVTSATVNGSALTLTGLTTFNSSGNILSGTETATGGVTVATGASLANSATVTGGATINGTLTGTGGSFSAASTLSGGTINLTSGTFGSTLAVTGTSAWNGAGGSVTGAVNETGGTFTIGSGANLTANGGLYVSGGTLAAGNASSTITGSVNYTSGSSSSFQGVIAGSGKTLTLNTSAATLTLSGANTFTGQLSVQQGTLSIASINNASANGVLGNSATAVILGNTGSQTGTLAYTGGNATSTKKFTMGTGGTGAFDVTTAGTTLGLSGLIDGSGNLVKSGAGTLTVSGNNTYSGTTTVSAGTFFVDGNQAAATGAVDIQANATLGGNNGTIGGSTTIEGLATLSPGKSSVSVLTFSNNLTFAGTTSKVLIDVATGSKGTNYDSVAVGGILGYKGAMTLSINAALASATYDLYSFTTGNYTGHFDSVAFTGTGPYSGSFSTADSGATFTANQNGQFLKFTTSTGDLTVVPEPASVALLVIGTTFLLWRRRKAQVENA